jgi:tryptophan halogenase
MSETLDNVVVVGRDAPLWIAASVLQSALIPAGVKITAVELPSRLQAHDVYASLPALEALHNQLRIDEAALLGRTQGTFSLGQNFVDASRATPSFFHAYGSYGAPIEGGAFFPYWLKARGLGLQVALEDFSLTAAAAKHGRMLIPDGTTEVYGRTDYAYHLPAVAYAAWMKRLAAQRGVVMHEALDVEVVLGSAGAAIEAVEIGDGRRIPAEFFIDVTGSEARLIGAALGVGRQSWREYFPADRRLTASANRFAVVPPYAEVRSWTDGWLSLHPAQSHTHVVHAYSSEFHGDDQALEAAVRVSGLALRDAAVVTSDPGRRTVAWDRNCVALGASACAFDGIHGVDLQSLQLGLVHLLALFPVHGDFDAERTEYNRTMRLSFERIRDFQSAYYVANRYGASAFWNAARHATASSELTHKMATFRARGDIPMLESESFSQDSWQALFIGLGMLPATYDPTIDRTSPETMKQEFRRILSFIKDKVEEQTSHDLYLRSVCCVA